MEPFSIVILSALVGFALAFALGWRMTKQARSKASQEAKSILSRASREAEIISKEQTSALQLELSEKRSEMERRAKSLEQEIESNLKEIRAHEEDIAALDHQLQLRERKIEIELEEAKASKRQLREMTDNARETMANLASMDIEQIKETLRQQVKDESQAELASLRKQILERSETDVQREATRTLLAAMQRLASKPSSDVTAAIIQLPNDDMKGRIIGREGRNIKCFEVATGTTLLIDESPQMVLISSFDPVRREVAKTALQRLVEDGRIHPASIEEFVSDARADVDRIIDQAGDDAVNALKISMLAPSIVSLLGKLKFRASYSQNVLEHSIEVGYLCSIIASELGLDPNLAKRAGLLHDIGKAIDAEYEGSHALAGADFIKAHGEDAIVVNAVAAHHEEVAPTSLYAGVVILADTISAVRPGARAESISSYIDRLNTLEELANSLPGVSSSYAIQAGREIRVVVNPESVDDAQAKELSRQLRERIESELQYPSSIRITVIREQRYVDTAK